MIKVKGIKNQRAQSMVEFALTLPILLLITTMIIDMGRVLLTFTQTSGAVRSALRYGIIVGNTPGTQNYLECGEMINRANQVMFSTSPTTTVEYIKANDMPSMGLDAGDTIACHATTDPGWLAARLENGDMLHISVLSYVEFITPLFPIVLPIDIEGQRTLVKDIQLSWSTSGGMGLDNDNGGAGDGLPDPWEDTYWPGVDPDTILPTGDPDADGCDNLCEFNNYTNPLMADTDSDGLTDGAEIFTHGTLPTVLDTDGDGLGDGLELSGPGVWAPTNPLAPDTDGDGVNDGDEVYSYDSDPNDPTDPSATVGTVTGVTRLPDGISPTGGSNCNALLEADRYIGWSWDPVPDADGYYIYVSGYPDPVGTTTSTSCGYGPAPGGCFNLDAVPWDPNGSLTYMVAAYDGPVIGPVSAAQTYACHP